MMASELHEAEDVVGDDVAHDLQDRNVSSGSSLDLKKTGRPAHPLWAHFHRGEKRNRYHYHAFCIYCVAKYGTEQINPTRGVSHDMLRHLEKCTNCPRKVLESIKEICGKRDADRIDQYMKRQNEENSAQNVHTTRSQVNTSSILSDTLDTSTIQESTTESIELNPQSIDDTHTTSQDESIHPNPTELSGVNSNSSITNINSNSTVHTNGHKRLKAFDPKEIKHQLLKTFVAAGLPFSCIQNPDFLQFAKYLHPEMTKDFFQSLFEDQFFQETTNFFGKTQFDRIKKGNDNVNRNSFSSSGNALTLSINSWTTKQKQHLVAFSLLNSSNGGDKSSMIAVEELTSGSIDTKKITNALEICIEKILYQLEQQKIKIIGIVVDSMLVFFACKRLCKRLNNSKIHVIPCFLYLLGLLASMILTHKEFDGIIQQMIEISSFFELQNLPSKNNTISFVVPNRTNWYSFFECIENLLKFQHFFHEFCCTTKQQKHQQTQIPSTVVKIIVDKFFWKKLEQLYQLLSPIKETYEIFFFQKKKQNIQISFGDIMYQFGRMSQQYAAVASTSATSSSTFKADIANLLRKQIDLLWKTYELPFMVLAFLFHFHKNTTILSCLNVHHEAIEWEMIGKYMKFYLNQWNQQEKPMQMLFCKDKIEEMFLQTNQFSFDPPTKAAISFPEISTFFCSHLYSISWKSTNLNPFIKGIGYVPSIAKTTQTSTAIIMALLQIGFASSSTSSTLSSITDQQLQQQTYDTKKNTKSQEDFLEATMRRNKTMRKKRILLDQHQIYEAFWTKEEWQSFRVEWQTFAQQEQVLCQQIQMEELQLMTSSTTTNNNQITAIKISLEEAFAKDLPSLLSQIHEEITLV